jgi:hypothetical protein
MASTGATLAIFTRSRLHWIGVANLDSTRLRGPRLIAESEVGFRSDRSRRNEVSLAHPRL